jgi:hypothetical protein
MNSKERRQRKYMRTLLNNQKKENDEFKEEIMRETHNKQMKEIKLKYGDKVSPNGGKNSFKTDG